MKYLFDLFLCKKDGWIQKNVFQDMKISTISGMTSLIRNLGQYGDVFKFAWDFLGTNIKQLLGEVESDIQDIARGDVILDEAKPSRIWRHQAQ